MTSFSGEKTRAKDVVAIVPLVYFPPITNYCLYYNGLPEFVRKRSLLTEK